MFDANVYYCWTCDAHRRAETPTSGEPVCPRCSAKLGPESQLGKTLHPDQRPIFALSIGHPVASSTPAWSGSVAAAR